MELEEAMSASDLSPDDWELIQDAVSNSDIDTYVRIRLVHALGDFAAASRGAAQCGQCEGTGTTQSASNLADEECPVCDGSGQLD